MFINSFLLLHLCLRWIGLGIGFLVTMTAFVKRTWVVDLSPLKVLLPEKLGLHNGSVKQSSIGVK